MIKICPSVDSSDTEICPMRESSTFGCKELGFAVNMRSKFINCAVQNAVYTLFFSSIFFCRKQILNMPEKNIYRKKHIIMFWRPEKACLCPGPSNSGSSFRTRLNFPKPYALARRDARSSCLSGSSWGSLGRGSGVPWHSLSALISSLGTPWHSPSAR